MFARNSLFAVFAPRDFAVQPLQFGGAFGEANRLRSRPMTATLKQRDGNESDHPDRESKPARHVAQTPETSVGDEQLGSINRRMTLKSAENFRAEKRASDGLPLLYVSFLKRFGRNRLAKQAPPPVRY
jgi:hypothetical protein